MISSETTGASPANSTVILELAGIDLTFRQVPIADHTPTGGQIAAAAGLVPAEDPYVLQFLTNGELVEILASQPADLELNGNRFLVTSSDRAYRLIVNGEQYDWPARVISGATIRKLATISPKNQLLLDREGEPDRLIGNNDLIDLGKAGVERFHTRKESWKLKVQDVTVESDTPTIVVSDAMQRAGFDISQPWHIYLKVRGQPKQPVGINQTIDLQTPGIEKIRLTPKDVNNGEAGQPRRTFAILDRDEVHLDATGWKWETVTDSGRRWLLIEDYPLPTGYAASTIVLALEIPSSYPGAQIDMFYVYPPLRPSVGGVIPATQTIETILGRGFQRWSRHRGPQSPWNPSTDNVITHLALVEGAIAKEVNQ
jgi:hypothetical protein